MSDCENSHATSSIPYRPEVDGLRAIAVLGVIIYHINPMWLPGGYLGVDIFFVISGYLLTAIISRQLQEERFSFKQFWLKRVRRLFPALCCMVLVVIWAGYWLQIRPERHQLIHQAIASVLSYQNMLLWQTTNGYWSVNSENIALLHTWSLSVEEQFYLFLPILLTLLNFSKLQNLRSRFTTLLIFASMVACYQLKSESFYLLPARMWELLLGSLVAFMPFPTRQDHTVSKVKHSFLIGTSLFLMISSFYRSSFFLLDYINIIFDLQFIGDRIATCAGTVIFLRYAHLSSIRYDPLAYLLQCPPVRYIGRISYSLYLWHWPLIVFSRYEISLKPIWLLTTLILLLSVLSFHFIETPFRRGFKGSNIYLASFPAVIALSLIALWLTPSCPLVPEAFKGFDNPDIFKSGESYEAHGVINDATPGVFVGKGRVNASMSLNVDICLIGSSHARVISTPIADYVSENDLTGLFMGTFGVEITHTHPAFKLTLNNIRHQAIADLRPRLSIVAGRWLWASHHEGFATEFKNRLVTIAGHSQKVLVLLQVPTAELPDDYKASLRTFIVSNMRAKKPVQISAVSSVNETNQFIRQLVDEVRETHQFNNIIIVDPTPLFIQASGYIKLSENNKFLYQDYQHINNFGAQLIFDNLIIEHMPNNVSK